MRWHVEPRPGVSPVELNDRGISSETAMLVGYKGNVPVITLPATRDLIEYFNAEVPKVNITIRSPKFARVFTKRLLPKRMLYSGSSPFRQIIMDEVDNYERRKKYINVYELADKVAKDTDENPRRLEQLIYKMNRAGQLVIRDGNVFAGIRHPELGVRREYPLVEFKQGVHPTKNYIYKYVENVGMRSYKEIEKRMFATGWIKRRTTLISYLKELIDEGCLKKIGGTDGKYGFDEYYEAVACGRY